jgi:integrase
VASLVEKGRAKDTIRLVVANLSAVLNHAIEARLIAHNPAIKMAKFFKEAKKKHEEISPLTADEVELFLGTAFEVFPDIYPVFLCAVHTGCRAGEIAGLQWGDVDFNGKFLMIRRGTGKLGTKTKTGKVRRVDASDELLNELDRMRRQRQAQYFAKGLNQIPEWVFCNREGNAMDMQNVSNRYFRPRLMKAGLQQRRFHDLRHTFASLLIQNGESLAYVRDQLGHTSIKTTVDIYGHLVPGANRQAVNRLPSLNNSMQRKAADSH